MPTSARASGCLWRLFEGAGLTVDPAALDVVEDETAHALRRLLVVQPLTAWQTLLRLRSVPLLSPLEPTEIPRALHTARRRWLASVSAVSACRHAVRASARHRLNPTLETST